MKKFTVEEVHILNRLGLPLNQARVYIALLRLGASDVKTISKTSGVDRSETYRIIEKLGRHGLVEKIVALPLKFEAVSISDAFKILIEQRTKEISKLKVATRNIVDKFNNSNEKCAVTENPAQFNLVPEWSAMRRKKRAFDNLQWSFDVVTSLRNPHSVIFDGEELIKALQRHVKIRVIVDKSDEEKLAALDTIKYLTKYPLFNIRYLSKAPEAWIGIFDEREAWIHTCINPMLKKCPSLRTNNPCLLSILQDYFENLWITAIERNSQDPRKPKKEAEAKFCK